MGIHERYDLTNVINAAGTFTPLGVSRSSVAVGQAVAEALSEFFLIDELQDVASAAISQWTGAEAGAVTHCVAAGITLAIAAAMAGTAPDRVAALPDTGDMPNRVVLPAGHAINYGHSILQDVRLAGATPVLAGSAQECAIEDLESELRQARTACLLLVSSRLVGGKPIDMARAVRAAHDCGLPAIIDGAAQDMRIEEILATGADLVLVSAQKYLASPTAGLVIGKKELVGAVRAHEKGIGRAMKPTKEGICGVLAAIDEREKADIRAWRNTQEEKVARFVQRANNHAGIRATSVADPVGMPFPRAQLTIDPKQAGMDAASLAEALKSGNPSVWVMSHALRDGQMILELVPLSDEELDIINSRISAILTA